MIWLVQDFGLLSVILRAIVLTLQTLTVGGILYLWLVLPSNSAPTLRHRALHWITRAAAALAIAGILYVATDSAVLIATVGLPLSALFGAAYFTAGLTIALLAAAIAIGAHLLQRSPSANNLILPILAAALMITSIFTSHAASRLDHQLLLSALTLLHQGAAAAWMGGIAFLLLSLRSPDISFEASRNLLRRFSCLALAGVAAIILSGVLLSVFYIGSAAALYGTAYGVMVLFKALLLAMIILVGAVNFSASRRGAFAHSTLTLLRRTTEIELALFFAVLLTAASLTSQPPGVDLVQDRLTAHELIDHFRPQLPSLHQPPLDTLAPATSVSDYVRSPDDTDRAAAHAIRDPDIQWSEFNHNCSGIFVLLIGLGALIAGLPGGRWARYWPLLFFPLSIFIMIVSDSENWPLGPNGYWESFADPEVALHRVVTVILMVYGYFEIRVQTGRSKNRAARLVFPIMLLVGGAGLLLHSHSLGNVKLELLAEISHTTIAVLGFIAGAARWAEIWLHDDIDHNPTNPTLTRTLATPIRIAATVWPTCLILIGLVLINYREM